MEDCKSTIYPRVKKKTQPPEQANPSFFNVEAFFFAEVNTEE